MRVNRPARWWLVTGVALAALGAASGCSSGASGTSAATSAGPVPSAYATPSGTTCGTTRTVINTPVVIKVTKGSVGCSTAMAVESSYTAALKNGGLKGNGGGAPITLSGWTCQGYPTPKVLQTGVTSDCHTATAEVVAVLDLSASSS